MINTKTCSNCNASFKCGATESDGKCWCNALPNIVPLAVNEDCLCPTCLKLKIDEMESAVKASATH